MVASVLVAAGAFVAGMIAIADPGYPAIWWCLGAAGVGLVLVWLGQRSFEADGEGR
jgi:hypothetical protein